MRYAKKLVLLILFVSGIAVPLTAENQSALSIWADLEGGFVWTGYNDVQIPVDGGTRFSLADDLDPDVTGFFRARFGVSFHRHCLEILFAPLKVESQGSLDQSVDFYGSTFSGSDLTGTFSFNSYRLSYFYRFWDRRDSRFSAGISLKLRDAYIALSSNGTEAKRENLGFVPLIRFSWKWFFARPFGLLFEGDALAAPQGRAEDLLLAFVFAPDDRNEIRLGYRFLEGGSDGGGEVYTFSMFHYLSAGYRRLF